MRIIIIKMGIEEIKKYIKFIGIKDYYKVNRLLQRYKARKIKIMTLKQEKMLLIMMRKELN